jgi:hypothetical protein
MSTSAVASHSGLREAVKEPIRSKVGALRAAVQGCLRHDRTSLPLPLRAAMGRARDGPCKEAKKERGEKICAHVPALESERTNGNATG